MKRAMVFIDFDNLAIPLREQAKRLEFEVLINAIKSKYNDGNDTCLVFGNCYHNYDGKSNQSMHAAWTRWITPIYAPIFSNMERSKSLADPMLICDALEALYTNPSIDVFVLVTSDKDFIPLIRKIAENGKEAIVIGLPGSDILINECNRLGFVFSNYLILEQEFSKEPTANTNSKTL